MKRGTKKIIFILGTSICLGCVALFGGGNKHTIISLADNDQEQSKKTCTIGVEAVADYSGTVFVKSDGTKLGNINTVKAISDILTKNSFLGKINFPGAINPKGYTWKKGYSRLNKQVKDTDFTGASMGGMIQSMQIMLIYYFILAMGLVLIHVESIQRGNIIKLDSV